MESQYCIAYSKGLNIYKELMDDVSCQRLLWKIQPALNQDLIELCQYKGMLLLK